MNERMTPRLWLALAGLTFSAFIFNTSEFVPVGLLSNIQRDFSLSDTAIGMLISVYAWVVMLMSLPLMLLVSRMEMKRLLLALLLLFGASHVVSFLSTSYAMLMVSRVGVACAHAVFWSIVSPMAVRIVPERYRSVALSTVVTGSSVALILGMPLGRMVGLHLGWRMTFLLIGLFAFGTLVYAALTLPRVPSRGRFSTGRVPALFADRRMSGLFLFTLIVSTGYYVAYSFIEPFLVKIAGMSASLCTGTLMLYGLFGFVGSLAFSRYYNRGRARFMTLMVGAMVVCLLLLRPLAVSLPLTLVACAVWGLSVTAYNVAMQSNIILAAPADGTAVAMSIFSGIYNLGIGFGAAIGGAVSTHSTVANIGYVGGALALLGWLFWLRWLGRKV